MSVRMRHTHAHTKNRRSHHSLDEQNLSTNEQGSKHLRHRVDPKTGTYRGRQVIDVQKKLDKKIAKQQAAMEAQGQLPETAESKKEEPKESK